MNLIVFGFIAFFITIVVYSESASLQSWCLLCASICATLVSIMLINISALNHYYWIILVPIYVLIGFVMSIVQECIKLTKKRKDIERIVAFDFTDEQNLKSIISYYEKSMIRIHNKSEQLIKRIADYTKRHSKISKHDTKKYSLFYNQFVELNNQVVQLYTSSNTIDNIICNHEDDECHIRNQESILIILRIFCMIFVAQEDICNSYLHYIAQLKDWIGVSIEEFSVPDVADKYATIYQGCREYKEELLSFKRPIKFI